MELKCFGGTASETNKATPFLCLLFRMLHLKPSFDIVLQFVRNADFKYLRILGAFYIRLVGTHEVIYTELEPLLADFRKLNKQTRTGWESTTVDQ